VLIVNEALCILFAVGKIFETDEKGTSLAPVERTRVFCFRLMHVIWGKSSLPISSIEF
jgi:hypothetical protein